MTFNERNGNTIVVSGGHDATNPKNEWMINPYPTSHGLHFMTHLRTVPDASYPTCVVNGWVTPLQINPNKVFITGDLYISGNIYSKGNINTNLTTYPS